MPFDFILPDLGEGITEAEIRKYLVNEGDIVEEHQTIFEVETDKAVVEVPSPRKGFILKIYKHEGDIANVGDVILTIGEKAEEEKKEERKSHSVVGVLPEAEGILATPAVRSIARKLGVNLEKIKGTGRGGRILEEDVLKASGGLKDLSRDAFGPVERVAIKGVRRTIAKNLIASMRSAAFVTGMDDADVTDLWHLKEKEKRGALERGIHLTFIPFFIKAVQHALAAHPMLNASVDEDGEIIIVKKYFNIGVAVDTPDGLKIIIEELKGSSFTISNFGSFGGTYATPILNYPDVAILGTGKVSERPWVKDEKIVIRKILSLSLTFDHRVVDGGEAAKFLNKAIHYLEDPDQIFIESA
ncbi:MAG: 2-oxo acid dehydrogenase subunit E2 [Deltaproteobacteria bacterium]|nr:2-oxo acid dehydrogenase subunit E2 [Deltaproteobacteria bacterium]